MSLLKLTSAQLRQAADLKEQIEALQNELNALHGTSAAATDAPLGRAKRAISAAGLAKIRAGQKKRWAKARKLGGAGTVAAKPGRRGPGKMSAEGRARIAAAQKKRWAKFHAGAAK